MLLGQSRLNKCGMGLKRSNGSIDPKKKLMLERIRSFFQSNEAIITINEKSLQPWTLRERWLKETKIPNNKLVCVFDYPEIASFYSHSDSFFIAFFLLGRKKRFYFWAERLLNGSQVDHPHKVPDHGLSLFSTSGLTPSRKKSHFFIEVAWRVISFFLSLP